MINLNAIKARLAAATPGPWRRGDNRDGRGSATIYARRVVVVRYVDNARDAILIANAPTDIAALIAEVERLRAVLDGPPICACGGTFTDRLTLRTNPQTERFVARIFGQ